MVCPATLGTEIDRVSIPDIEQLSALYMLERVSGFGPVKFRAIYEAGINPTEVLKCPEKLPIKGRIGEKLRIGIDSLSVADEMVCEAAAKEQIDRARAYKASVLTYHDIGYPARIYASNNPVPVLYVRGDPAVWAGGPAIAVVGSRNTREPYASSARTFAAVAAQNEVLVVSGFALGADSIAHQAAIAEGGKTVCVMPCGLDYVFPPENLDLWEELLATSKATFVSEFRFGLRASSLTLRKRNKLIVAFVHGVLVAQSATNGGAMNAYRFALHQKKMVATFICDNTVETTGNAVIENDRRTGGLALKLNGERSEYEKWLRNHFF